MKRTMPGQSPTSSQQPTVSVEALAPRYPRLWRGDDDDDAAAPIEAPSSGDARHLSRRVAHLVHRTPAAANALADELWHQPERWDGLS